MNAVVRPPYNEDAALMMSRNQEWGHRGDYCREVFEKRVEHWGLPKLIVEAKDQCAKGQGASCVDLAGAARGGCGDLEVDEQAAYALAKKGCDLGAFDGCRTYVGWCSAWSSKGCDRASVDDARRKLPAGQ